MVAWAPGGGSPNIPSSDHTLLDRAKREHAAGQAAVAEDLYARVISAVPADAAEAHRCLGILCAQTGRLAQAIEHFETALRLDPGDAVLLNDLGSVYQSANRTEEAISAYRQAIARRPDFAAAHFHLGTALHHREMLAEAADSYRRALSLKPGMADAHLNLGVALQQLERHPEAEAAFRNALSIDRRSAAAYFNLGISLTAQGRAQEAVAAYRAALDIDPAAAHVLVNLASALRELSDIDGAIHCLKHAIALEPELTVAHRSLAIALRDRGLLEEAFAAFRRHAELSYEAATAPKPKPHKIKHDREQLEYLAQGADGPRKGRIGGGIREQGGLATAAHAPLVVPFHTEGGGQIDGAVISARDRRIDIEAQWSRSRPKIVVVDDVLSPEALQGLRRFCWGSTIWRIEYEDGYLGAVPESGFAAPLLLQVALELSDSFPRIFRGHRLLQCWAFKYDSELSGVRIHADFAAVNVNLWITPDEANLDPEHGGLVIWDKPAPAEWDYPRYNNLESDEIREFLARSAAQSVTVPHRSNRAVIFDSDLFHETDRMTFKDGYLNRRINITLLYGLREHDTG